MSLFEDSRASHRHSLDTLDILYSYDEFMESIKTLADLGCGEGLDLEWWATRTTNEDNPKPLNIKCVGFDTAKELPVAHNHSNVIYQSMDFEDRISSPLREKFDVLWCHDAFQYAINPLATLSKWYDMASDGAMLIIIVPQTTNVKHHKFAFSQESNIFYHYTLVNLIHMLAMSGWDCKSGFFLKRPTDPWIHAVVYKSNIPPMDPKTTNLFDLSETGLLPETAVKSINAHGEIWQQDLTLPWLDHSLTWYGAQ